MIRIPRESELYWLVEQFPSCTNTTGSKSDRDLNKGMGFIGIERSLIEPE